MADFLDSFLGTQPDSLDQFLTPPPDADRQIAVEGEQRRLKAHQPELDRIYAEEAAKLKRMENDYEPLGMKRGEVYGADIQGRLEKDAPWLSDEQKQAAAQHFQQQAPRLAQANQMQQAVEEVRSSKGLEEPWWLKAAKVSPFARSGAELGADLPVIAAGKRFEAGQDNWSDRYQLARHLVDMEKEKKRQEEGGFSGRVLDMLSQLPATLAEWYTLGGAGELGRAAAGKAGETAIGNIAGALAAGAVRTAADPAAVAAGTARRMVPQVGVGAGGQVQVAPGESLGAALPGAAVQKAIENIAWEAVGGPLNRSRGLMAAVGTPVITTEAQEELSQVVGGPGGTLSRLRNARTDEERESIWKDLAAKAVVFGALGATHKGPEAVRKLAAEMKADFEHQGWQDNPDMRLPPHERVAGMRGGQLAPFNPQTTSQTLPADTAPLPPQEAPGGPQAAPQPAPAPTPPQAIPTSPEAAQTPPAPPKPLFADVSFEDVKGIANQLGLSAKGGKADVIARISKSLPEPFLRQLEAGALGKPPPEAPQPPREPPPPKKGMVRMYHGAAGGGEPGDWASPQREYAEGYANKGGPEGKTFYVDVPEGKLEKAFDDSGINMKAPPTNQQIPPEYAKQFKELPRLGGPKEPSPEAPPAPPAPEGGKPWAVTYGAQHEGTETIRPGDFDVVSRHGSQAEAHAEMMRQKQKFPGSGHLFDVQHDPEEPPEAAQTPPEATQTPQTAPPPPQETRVPPVTRGDFESREKEFNNSGLSERQKWVMHELATGRDMDSIATDPQMLKKNGEPMRRQGINYIKNKAMEKLPEDYSTEAEQEATRKHNVMYGIESGARVARGELSNVPADEEKVVRGRMDEIRDIDRKMSDLSKKWVKLGLAGKLTPEKEQELHDEFAALDNRRKGRLGRPTPAPGQLPDEASPAEGVTPAQPDRGGGPEAGGPGGPDQAEATGAGPAPAGPQAGARGAGAPEPAGQHPNIARGKPFAMGAAALGELTPGPPPQPPYRLVYGNGRVLSEHATKKEADAALERHMASDAEPRWVLRGLAGEEVGDFDTKEQALAGRAQHPSPEPDEPDYFTPVESFPQVKKRKAVPPGQHPNIAEGKPFAMGAAAQGELTPAAPGEGPRGPTALANATIDAERLARGQSPIIGSARMENSEAWDQAMRRLDVDPGLGRKLAEEVADKARPLDVVEQAVLLHEKVRLDNEARQLGRQLLEAQGPRGGLDAQDLDTLKDRVDAAERARYELHLAARRTGTELGRSLGFRRQLAAEDYSLEGLTGRAMAAKGAPLTAEERAQFEGLSKRILDLQKQLAEAEARGERTVEPKSGKVSDLGKADEKVRDEADTAVADLQEKAKPTREKVADLFTKIRINEVISSLTTLAKLPIATIQRVVTYPLYEAAGLAWRALPPLAKIAAMAPREGRGLSPAVEVKAFYSALTEGARDAWQTFRTGKSELDIRHKAGSPTRTWLDMQFSLHDALKAPAVRNEYTRSYLQRVDSGTARGTDVSSPAAVLRMQAEAYVDAQRAKFRGENWLVDATNRALTPKPGASLGEFVAKKFVKGVAVPVLRIPTNIVTETGQHIFGVGTGTYGAIRAYARGIETLKPAEADLIMRQFKRGSLGLGLLALGYFKPDLAGGYYQDDEKRREAGEPKVGAVKLGGVELPAWTQHNPLLQTLQFGATVRRVEDSLHKGEPKGIGAGVLAGVFGLAEETPQGQAAKEAYQSFSAKERGWFLGQSLKSLTVPQLVQWLAGTLDVDPQTGEPVKRRPEGVLEHVKTGLPWLRPRVPAGR